MPNQYANQNGPRSHYESTGPEIWRDTEGRVTHFVAGVGTGGTITGAGRYLREVSGDAVRIVGADPVGSIYSGGPVHGYDVEGVGEDFWPTAYDPAVVDEIHRVSDAESFAMTRRLAREEGLLVGGSSGMAVVAALRTARDLPEDAVVVVLLPDHGRGYLSKLFDDDWMTAHGYPTDATDPATAPRRRKQRMTEQTPGPARGFDSLAVHAGQAFDPTTGAVIPPVHFSTTYAQDGIGGLRQGYEYGRSGNPTRTALETQLAAIEGGRHGLSFSSGLAAEDALLRSVLKPGDEVLLGSDVYGGTYRLIARILGPVGRGPPHRRHERPRRRRRGAGGASPPASCGSRRRATRCCGSPTSPGSRGSGRMPELSWWSTTPSPPPLCSSPCRSAPMSSCTRRRSTSAVTPTSSAAPSF